MAQIISSANFNPAALQAPGVYIVLSPPPASSTGILTDIGGVIGTASWGPVNTPVLMGSQQDATTAFGSVTAAALTDMHDLATDLTLAFMQAANGALFEAWGVRVTDGSDVKASVVLDDNTTPTPVAGGTLQALYSGTQGDAITAIISAGTLTNTATVKLIGFANGYSEVFPNLPTGSGAFWAALASALANGISGLRGPSQLARFGQLTQVTNENDGAYQSGVTSVTGTLAHPPIPGTVTITLGTITATDTGGTGVLSGTGVATGSTINYDTGAFTVNLSAATSAAGTAEGTYKWLNQAGTSTSTNPPALASYTLSGGTDGRANVTTADLTGSAASYPYTGAYALVAANPPVNGFWIAGLSDSTAYANMQALADEMGAFFMLTFPTGTSSTAAVAALQGYGVSDYNVLAVKDWLYFFDSVNNQVRLVPPLAVAAGRILALSPEQSPLNKPVYGVIGTERMNPLTGVNQPYTLAEIGLLNSSGILLINNPSIGGNYFGFRTGVSTAANQTESPVEFGRMTNFLGSLFGQLGGQFVGELQSANPGDPLRASVRAAFNTALQQLKRQGQIAGYNVTCDASNNPQASVAGHKLFVYVSVTYLSSVWYFIAQLTGGTTVVTSASSQNAALQLAA